MTKKLNILNLLLFVALFPVLAILVRDYLTYAYVPVDIAPRSGAASSAPAGAPPIDSYAPVVEAGLFPSEKREFKPVDVSGDMLSEAQASGALASMRLLGTFTGSRSFVVVGREGEAREKTFRVGEPVYGAGQLKEVRRASAIISIGGRDFALVMPEDDIDAPRPAGLSAPADYRAAKDIVWRPAASVRKTGDNAFTIDQKAVLYALDNLGDVLTDARLKPVAGGAGGFLVDEVVPGGIFDAIGLKNADTLKRVNGFDVTSPEKAVKVLMGLRGSSRIELDIERGGKKIKLQYDIR